MSARLSVCMIVKNEAKNIARCLESIKEAADEIIVVDTGSIDNTKDIAKQYGAKVYDFEWVDDFSKARNYSIEKASGDWIFILDGDDELERRDIGKLVKLINEDDTADMYLMNTICYTGDIAGNDKIMNINIRLFKNKPEFRYYGRIHEGLKPSRDFTMEVNDITVYHYGYLNSNVKEQNKRERNMRIIGEQLKENPENPYFLFCMGNEYLALNKIEKALEYFLAAYQRSKMQDLYIPKLLIRIIMSYQYLNQYDCSLNYIDKTLKYYPEYTDAEYVRGSIYHKMGYITKAIKSFQRCLEMGEPPSILSFIIGVGTYRAYFALGRIHQQLGELDEALNYFNKAILSKNDFYDAAYAVGSIITKKYSKPEEIRENLERIFVPDEGNYAVIADILYLERQYQLALGYINLALKHKINNTDMLFLKAKCMFNLNMYKEAIEEFQKIDINNKYYLNSNIMCFLCYLILDEFDNANTILKNIEKLNCDEKICKLLYCLNNIYQSRDKIILSVDVEESSKYLLLIIDILDNLLSSREYDRFEKALELFNCIESDQVLLALSKLYNKHGFIQMAANEIKRSISTFDKLDEESAYILYKSFSYF